MYFNWGNLSTDDNDNFSLTSLGVPILNKKGLYLVTTNVTFFANNNTGTIGLAIYAGTSTTNMVKIGVASINKDADANRETISITLLVPVDTAPRRIYTKMWQITGADNDISTSF